MRNWNEESALRLGCRLRLIDHEGGHLLEECAKVLFDLDRQSSLDKRFAHQRQPAVAGGLIDPERKMSRPQAGMSSLFNVSLRTSEPIDQEIAKALFGAFPILRRIHPSQNVVLRDLAIKGGHEARETFLSNDRANLGFLHRKRPGPVRAYGPLRGMKIGTGSRTLYFFEKSPWFTAMPTRPRESM